MLFAVASKDGKEVNQHFGHVERFLIYQVEGESVTFLEERPVEKYCRFDPDHPLRAHTLKDTADALHGCRAVVCSMIGEAPRIELDRLGVEPYVVEGEIIPVLKDLAKVL
ncbi:NifB/NifX family molybdenum-iron cluster-binding protein [Geomonas propionica]|uniref:Dinitrogenase iron-molybdenum cofactor biosynthesis protein n=1 Tax=Geomonas propionica TaxID=2798582 RepID=A0ABS0YSF7_9BACT|nr:NifB/NifX family molybdenum-iron cluster-binding protein [Geomonas propionica]MBJ6800893.1 dinitrogenase iron-molybdenum cofactor biosynthesis protein [Geomonas propionica]